MQERHVYGISTLFSFIALVLVVVNIFVALNNRSLQMEATTRQAAVNAGQKYSQLNESLVQALAEASVKDNNSQIRGLLASQGITVKVNNAGAATEPVAAPATESPRVAAPVAPINLPFQPRNK